MENFAILLFSFLSITSFVYSQTTDSLIIIPEKTKLLKLEGDKLQLDCVHTFTGDSDVMATFKKDGITIPTTNDRNYNITMTKKVVTSNTYRSTTTLIKNVTDTGDQGVFQCSATDRTTEINVYIFTVTNEDADLPVPEKDKEIDMVQLQCKLNGLDPTIDFNFTWEHGNEQLKDDEKYNMFDNGTLQIKKPTRADMGEYQCSVIFFPNSEVEKHTVKSKPAVLRAGPNIDSHDNNKNMVQGDDLELKCEVSGYPMPTVAWFKDGAEINTTTRIHTLDYKGALGKLMIFSLEDADEGYYKCIATNDVKPYNATAEMKVGVKVAEEPKPRKKNDKLAALWPFLGIVAEVIVLCVIILVYERRRSKKLAEEEDAADGNQDNTVDHKDVRHRRT